MFRLFRSIPLFVVLVPLAAQSQSRVLREGERVKVTHRCEVVRGVVFECRDGRARGAVTGHVLSVSDDTVRIRAQSGVAELAIPTASIAQVLVADGKRGNALPGAVFGLFAGALLGVAVGSELQLCGMECSGPLTDFGVIIGAPVGFLLGGVVGAFVRSDRWRAVAVPDRRVSVQPRLGGLGLKVAVAF